MKQLINKLKELEKESKGDKVEISADLLHATINTLLTYDKKTNEIEQRISVLEAKFQR